MVMMPIDRNKLIDAMKRSDGVVKYRLGAKPRLDSVPGKGFKTSDCSGFVRWILYWSTTGRVTIPLGSWHQNEWFRNHKYPVCPYSDCAKADSVLRIAFIFGDGGKVGHVWLVINGRTIESYGGKGFGRRAWNTRVLIDNVDACYVISNRLP